VSVTGVTGVYTQLQARVKDLLMEIRGVSNKPIGIGFGISARTSASGDGLGCRRCNVGSAFVKRLADGTPTQGLQSIEELCRSEGSNYNEFVIEIPILLEDIPQ